MKLEKVYIGGWFQRTTLQLSEIYDFLRYAKSELALDKDKLVSLHEALGVKTVDFEIEGLELLKITTEDEIDTI